MFVSAVAAVICDPCGFYDERGEAVMPWQSQPKGSSQRGRAETGNAWV